MDTNTTQYALATALKGFRATALRVVVTRREAGLVWVRTADLLDAGTSLVLKASQVSDLPEASATLTHRGGLVSFGA